MRNPAAHGRPDSNQAEIVKAYEDLGCSVFDAHQIGRGFPDLVIGIGRVYTGLVEIKTQDGDLNGSQVTFHRDWRGATVQVVRSVEDVVRHVTEIRARYFR